MAKKAILILLGAVLCANVVMAQTVFGTPTAQSDASAPTKDIDWFGEGRDYQDAGQAEADTGIRRVTPIAPATLLLLGLGGAVVGGKVLRNKKEE